MKWLSRGVLAFCSMVLTGVLLTGTSYASISEVMGGGAAQMADFLAEKGFARATRPSGGGGVILGRAHSYANDRIKIYEIPPNVLEVFGFAPNSTRGIRAAQFHKDASYITTDPKGTRLSVDENGWYVIIYYLGLNEVNRQVFQINLYNAAGVLQDDSYRFDRDDPTKIPPPPLR